MLDTVIDFGYFGAKAVNIDWFDLNSQRASLENDACFVSERKPVLRAIEVWLLQYESVRGTFTHLSLGVSISLSEALDSVSVLSVREICKFVTVSISRACARIAIDLWHFMWGLSDSLSNMECACLVCVWLCLCWSASTNCHYVCDVWSEKPWSGKHIRFSYI